ncbi:MAG: TolC family protein [Pseudomonadota bacterium]
MRTFSSPLFGTLVGLVLASCATVPPAPDAPNAPMTSESYAAANSALVSQAPIEIEWWAGFSDPLLTDLVNEALAENKSLAIAEANVSAARAILARQSLGRSYSTSATTNAELGRAARQGADTELSASGQLGASWEYDAFGRIASQIESAALRVEQLDELRRDAAVTIAANTALTYVDYRGNQVRLAVAQRNADLQGESVELLRVLFENGRATRLDVERAESQYRTTLASLPLLEINIRTAATQLAVLTGRSDLQFDETALDPIGEIATIPVPPETLTVGRPEELIRRRPDIRAAEANISRLLALGEVERARLFPTLTFNANLLSLFTKDSTLDNSFGFGIGPALRWDGPDLRRVRADIEIADAQTRVAFADYENTVIEALGEVEIALISYVQERARRVDLEAAAVSAERALELARLRFDEGLDDFLDVIDAQRTLLDAQDRLEISRLATTRQAIAAYRALGGIWQDAAFIDATPESE